MKSKLLLFYLVWAFCSSAQPVPSEDEKIRYLVTFSKQAKITFGDDDFVQVFFFVVPENSKDPVYIRVFDPDVGGKNDENRGGFNSQTSFSVYGGKGVHSDKDAKLNSPAGNYKAGIELGSKTFNADGAFDDKWFTFGPFNPVEGELQPDYGGYVFKIIVEGLEGDDGNLYKMFLSKNKDNNVSIEGGNSFSYEKTFRLDDLENSIAHIYPFIAANVKTVQVNVFDYDDDGIIRMVTVAKKGVIANSKTDGTWSTVDLNVVDEELNTSMDIQFIKKKKIKNNNVVVYITNQYKELLPFFTIPIGGVPKYKYKIGVKPGK
jgi:hypothetical protein